MCVYVYVMSKGNLMPQCACGSKDNQEYQSSPSTLFETGSYFQGADIRDTVYTGSGGSTQDLISTCLANAFHTKPSPLTSFVLLFVYNYLFWEGHICATYVEVREQLEELDLRG